MEIKTPKQLANDGQAEYNKGDYLSAARLYKAAADGFLLISDELSATEMLNNSSVAYLRAGDAQAALDLCRDTDQIFASAGDIKRQAMAVGNQAAALDKLNRVDEAISYYERSAALLQSAGEYELRAYVYQAISELQLRQGRYLEAYASMRVGIMGMKDPNLSQRILKSLINVPFKFLQ